MSCNGCRVLRKGCCEACVLRPCLRWIDGAAAQGRATLFVAKFFGRAGLMSFLAAVPEPRRPNLFRSLLFEACGRTVNPVDGAVGLLAMGRWHLCRQAVETVLRGGTVWPALDDGTDDVADEAMEDVVTQEERVVAPAPPLICHLELSLSPWSAEGAGAPEEPAPSAGSEGSVTSAGEVSEHGAGGIRLLNLFD